MDLVVPEGLPSPMPLACRRDPALGEGSQLTRTEADPHCGCRSPTQNPLALRRLKFSLALCLLALAAAWGTTPAYVASGWFTRASLRHGFSRGAAAPSAALSVGSIGSSAATISPTTTKPVARLHSPTEIETIESLLCAVPVAAFGMGLVLLAGFLPGRWSARSSKGEMALLTVTGEHQAPPSHTRTLADEVRGDFPLLKVEVHPDVPLVYLDSAATSQKPRAVLDALDNYYLTMNSNVHRGAHTLGNRATEAYENARDKVAGFVGAPGGAREIVFTRGATEAINLVANTWGIRYLKEGDEVILSVMEHHANLVPWQMVAQRTGATLRFVQLTPTQEYDFDHFLSLLSPRTKLVALPHVSNVLGCINPVKDVVAAARTVRARVLLDACQSVPHMPVDVADLGVDWLVASGHKMCGPTGIGFLWGKYDVLESMPPWQGGGEMIDEVRLEGATYAPPPGRFEAGTPAIAQAVGLGAACDYLSSLGMARVQHYEHELAEYLWVKLSAVEGLELYGPPPRPGQPRAALVAFNDTRGTHSLDLLAFLDLDGIALRTGHHCTQPLHTALGQSSSARASLYIYNTFEEVDRLVDALHSSLHTLRS